MIADNKHGRNIMPYDHHNSSPPLAREYRLKRIPSFFFHWLVIFRRAFVIGRQRLSVVVAVTDRSV